MGAGQLGKEQQERKRSDEGDPAQGRAAESLPVVGELGDVLTLE